MDIKVGKKVYDSETHCNWCSKQIPKSESRFCSPECESLFDDVIQQPTRFIDLKVLNSEYNAIRAR